MKHTISAEFKRAINWKWIIAIAGIFFSICFDSWNDLILALKSGHGEVHYFFWNSSWGGVCRHYLLPIFSTLPFSTSFCVEYNSQTLPYIISREGKRRYCRIKFIINGLCGGLVAAIATVLLLMLLSAVFPMINLSEVVPEDVNASDRFHFWLAIFHPFIYELVEICSAFLRGMIWSSVALCVSVFVTDSFVVLISPYLFNFMLVQTYRLLHIRDIYRLDKLFTGNMIINSSLFTLSICTFVTIFITALLGFIFENKLFRRLKNGLYC